MTPFAPFGARLPPRAPEALAREILSQARFRVRLAAPQRTWWDAVQGWIGAEWNRLVDAFAHHVRIGAGTSIAFGDLLVAAIVAIIAIVTVRLLLGMVRESSGRGPARAPAHAHASAHALHAFALQAAERGAYDTAVALLFNAALTALDARGVLRDDPARTVKECTRDVRARVPRAAFAFEVLARGFTAAVYAEDRVTPQHWADAERAYAAFVTTDGHAA